MRWIVILLTTLTLAGTARAQNRSSPVRARMELAIDLGYGGGSEGAYGELAMDFRVWAPEGLGVIVRTGAATNLWSTAFAADLGFGARLDLERGARGGLQLALGIGATYARGPFDGEVDALGGFGTASLELWHDNWFLGLGATAHALAALAADENEPTREDPLIWTLAPMLRMGGDWGL
jgi:hypothetical protein